MNNRNENNCANACAKKKNTENFTQSVSPLLQDISDNRMIFLDGAMGTMLQNSGLRLGERPEALCITNPDVVEKVHRQYIESGSSIVYANTFGANSHKLEGTGYCTDEIVRAAVTAAKRAATLPARKKTYMSLSISGPSVNCWSLTAHSPLRKPTKSTER